MNEIKGAFAKWVCQQSPYHSVRGVDRFNTEFETYFINSGTNYLGNFHTKEFESDWEIIRFLDEFTKTNLITKLWNTPKRERQHLPSGMISKYDEDDPDCDFIDIDALIRNVGMEVWRANEDI